MTIAIISAKPGTVAPAHMVAPTASRAQAAPAPAPSAFVLKPATTPTQQAPVRTMTATAPQAPAYAPKQAPPQAPTSYASNQRQASAPACPACPTTTCPTGDAAPSRAGLWMFLAGLAVGGVGVSAALKRG